MRIRTMLKRKMKLIWKERGTWLVSAPPAFSPISSAAAMPEKMGTLPFELDLVLSMPWNKTSAFIVF